MLPIEPILPQLFSALAEHDKVILQAPPGAGKSTFLPLQLIKNQMFKGRIIMLEPRRLAARSIAEYLAMQLGETVGQRVGYRVRQDVKVSAATVLEIVTEGILTRMIQSDPELSGIDLIIFDEFHERSIHADLALALSLDSQSALRDDLTLLLMSATLDSEYLSKMLDAPIITSEGRSYPVEMRYLPTKPEQMVACIGSLITQLLDEESGSMLVFLPGAKEINQLAGVLAGQSLSNSVKGNVKVYPLYGDLAKKQQQAAIAPCVGGERKIVIATNIAETSLTIDGIRIVIDSGLKRHASFNPKNGITKLQTTAIAKSSAIQRAGRAGRLMPGIGYRLDSAEIFERRMDFDQPEILTSDLMPLVLEVANWGADIDDLLWVNAPPKHLVAQARQLLVQLEILEQQSDQQFKVTAVGHQVSALGCHPRIAHMLLKAKTLSTELEVPVDSLACYLAAIIEEADPLPKGMRRDNSTIEARVRWMLAGKAPQVLQQARVWAKRINIRLKDSLPLEYCGVLLALAFPDRIAKSRGKGFQMSNGFGIVISDNDPLSFEPMLVVADLIEFDSRVYVGMAATISEQQIESELPHLLTTQDFVGWDKKGEKLVAETQTTLGRIVLCSKPAKGGITNGQRVDAFIALIKVKGLDLLAWDDEAVLLRLRLNTAFDLLSASDNCWPDYSDEALLGNLNDWLAPYLNNVRSLAELKKFDLKPALLSRLDWNTQQKLDNGFPERFKVPTGAHYKIEYRADQPPKLSVRIQEMFGLTETPMLANGRLPLVIELLSPARRPLQLTQDLAGFWQGSYEQVKKEMKGRYPRHYWPDDPAVAMPTNRVKKRM
ncbi:MAG: ATP-dependent helicase HrpB [Phenylobacterium sp.]|jgi:ATP-dependent helicase HrpB